MSEEAKIDLIRAIEAAQWRVAIVVGCASIILAVALAWLLARSDIAYIHEMIRSAECHCKTAANTNTMTINADAIRERAIHDILNHQGSISDGGLRRTSNDNN